MDKQEQYCPFETPTYASAVQIAYQYFLLKEDYANQIQYDLEMEMLREAHQHERYEEFLEHEHYDDFKD